MSTKWSKLPQLILKRTTRICSSLRHDNSPSISACKSKRKLFSIYWTLCVNLEIMYINQVQRLTSNKYTWFACLNHTHLYHLVLSFSSLRSSQVRFESNFLENLFDALFHRTTSSTCSIHFNFSISVSFRVVDMCFADVGVSHHANRSVNRHTHINIIL